MSYDLMFQKAIELQNNGALNEALEIYQKLLLVTPYNSDIWNLMGCIAQSRREDKKAVDCFLNAIKYSKIPFGMYYFNLSLSYKALSCKVEAMEAMVKASQLMSDVKEVWNFLGLLQAEIGDVNNAIKSFCKALEIDENYKEARANLCFYTKDIDTLLKLADEDDKDFRANYLAAKAVDDMDKKEKYFLRAYEIDKERSDVLVCLGTLYIGKGDKSKALTYYHKALVLAENDVEAMLGCADIYLSLKDYEKAQKYYLKSFDLGVKSVGAYVNYGALLFETKRYSEALEFYRKALSEDADNSVLCYNLALILKEVGEYEEALGLMFSAYLKESKKDEFVIGIMETLAELFTVNAELSLKIAENWQKLEPENIFSKRILKGVSGIECDLDDVNFAKRLFDSFASSYDEVIERVDSKIIDKFMTIYGKVSGKVLDLGCGTGLVGQKIANNENSIVGVDVSSKMLDKALEKNIYEELICEDILKYVSKNKIVHCYDLVLAFDVFCYLGSLDEILKKLKGVEFWFSIELADENRKEDFYLMPNGRYKHQERYIQKLAKAIGFKEIIPYYLDLRLENGEPVKGVLFKLK